MVAVRPKGDFLPLITVQVHITKGQAQAVLSFQRRIVQDNVIAVDSKFMSSSTAPTLRSQLLLVLIRVCILETFFSNCKPGHRRLSYESQHIGV